MHPKLVDDAMNQLNIWFAALCTNEIIIGLGLHADLARKPALVQIQVFSDVFNSFDDVCKLPQIYLYVFIRIIYWQAKQFNKQLKLRNEPRPL